MLNNVDVIILIVVGISALIALSRGLIKEVLSIIGWVLSLSAVVYLLPIINPIMSRYIMSGIASGIVTTLLILIGFMIIWILLTGQLVGKVRKSRLGTLDRFLGLFFGVARAFLLIILANILISWIIPREKQSPALTESKYFQIAGNFAQPIESLIPEDTLEAIRKKASEISSDGEDDTDEENKTKKTETDLLFEKLTQPQIKKKKAEVKKEIKENIKKLEKPEEKAKPKAKSETEGYDSKERNDLDRLIDSVN